MTPRVPPAARALAAAIAVLLASGCATVSRPAPGELAATAAPPAPAAPPDEAPAAPSAAGAPGEATPGAGQEAPPPDRQAAGAEAPAEAPPPEPAPPDDAGPEPGALERIRARLVELARRRLGLRFRGDCSGFVLRTYRDAGVRVAPTGPARSRTEALHRASAPVIVPRPGDLAFFHDTYDRNHDRRLDDAWTHVALVERVHGSSYVLIHRSVRGVERLRMDLAHPSDEERNDVLRIRRRGDPRGTRYLAGQLFTAFGALLRGGSTQMLQAGRAADTSAVHPATR